MPGPSHPCYKRWVSLVRTHLLPHPWRRVLLAGTLLWLASIGTLALTEDKILLPCVVLVGSFLVPVAGVFWLLEHQEHTELEPSRLVSAFFVAGVTGLLAAAELETWLLPHRVVPDLWVGLIEEATKGLGVVVYTVGLKRFPVRDGIILGATIGLGFGAFESSGYTLSYGFRSGTFSMTDLLSEELLRAVIAPFCHGVWTGLVGAAVFAAARGAKLHLVNAGIVLAYLVASLLHAVWDASSNAGVVVTVLLAGTEDQRQSLADWALPAPGTLDAQMLLTAVEWVVMGAVGLAGVLLLRRGWRTGVVPGTRVDVSAENDIKAAGGRQPLY
jgi:RsiW-degrading membrane proteinase PrsW (M82 family)